MFRAVERRTGPAEGGGPGIAGDVSVDGVAAVPDLYALWCGIVCVGGEA